MADTGRTEMKAIQYMAEFDTADEARGAWFGLMQIHEGFIGGRVIHPSPTKGPKYRVQAFFKLDRSGVPLPDGCREVFIPDSQARSVGIILSTDAWDA